jgi:release factor glutamine methyltransferase
VSDARPIEQWLRQARALGVDRLDAQCLVAHVLQRPRSWVLAHADEPLPAQATARLDALLQQRADQVPLAYLLGEREFHGLRLRVTPEVLDPRPDTETLADWALELLAGELGQSPHPALIDLGTGSGAIALAIAHNAPQARVSAVDRSAAALAVAQANAQALGLDVAFTESDWWSAVPMRGDAPDGLSGFTSFTGFDLVVSNPPYIAADDTHLAALRHEPREALTPEGDGLGALQAIVRGAPAHLRPGGWLLLEHGHEQGPAVERLLREAGFEAIGCRRDLQGHVRCTGGRLAE